MGSEVVGTEPESIRDASTVGLAHYATARALRFVKERTGSVLDFMEIILTTTQHRE